MVKEQPVFATRSKIWIKEIEGNVVFGLGRYRMLDMIQQLGSMHAAAGQLQMRTITV